MQKLNTLYINLSHKKHTINQQKEKRKEDQSQFFKMKNKKKKHNKNCWT